MKTLTKMHTENVEYQIIFSLALGLLFAPFGYDLIFSIYFIVFFEVYVFLITEIYPPSTRMMDRVVINLFFIFGWVISRMLYRNETGFEGFFKSLYN